MKRVRFLSLVLVLVMLVSTFSVEFTSAQSGRPLAASEGTDSFYDYLASVPAQSGRPLSLQAAGLSLLPTTFFSVTKPGLSAMSAGSDNLVSIIVQLEEDSFESQLYPDLLFDQRRAFEARLNKTVPCQMRQGAGILNIQHLDMHLHGGKVKSLF